jgi:hypothetical protein
MSSPDGGRDDHPAEGLHVERRRRTDKARGTNQGLTAVGQPIFDMEDDFPDGLRAAIGDVVIVFGRLEYVLMLCYKSLKREGFEVGMAEIVKKGKMFTNLCEKVEALATEDRLPEPHRTKLLGLIANAKALAEERNHIVHACWTSWPDGGANRVRAFIPRGEKEVEWNEQSGPVPIGDLRALAAHVDGLLKAINHARRKEWPTLASQRATKIATEEATKEEFGGPNDGPRKSQQPDLN